MLFESYIHENGGCHGAHFRSCHQEKPYGLIQKENIDILFKAINKDFICWRDWFMHQGTKYFVCSASARKVKFSVVPNLGNALNAK